MEPRNHGKFIFNAFTLPLIALINIQFGKDFNGIFNE